MRANEEKCMRKIEKGENETGKKEGSREKWELMKRNAWEKLRKGKMRQERRKEKKWELKKKNIERWDRNETGKKEGKRENEN